MYSIEVENLTKNFSTKIKTEGFKQSVKSMIHPEYQSVDAVQNISFKVKEGEIVAFIGPNGAGKSTTIKMMTGILHPTSGVIKVLGLDPVKNRRVLAKQIGTVFGQKSQLWFHLPPTDSFRLLGDIYEVPEKEYKKRIDYLIDIFDISELLKTPVRKMSLGQRVRCEIAASLIHQPKILFLDEPTIGLDVVVKQKIRELILNINKEYNTTIFLTSHDAGDIEKICKRAMVIDHGKVVLDESVKNLKYDYLRRKIVAAKFSEKFQPIKMDGVEIIKSTDYAASLHVDTELVSINKVISAISQGDSLADITITDPPMEEIILDIFKKTAVNKL
ncbi:MAG: ATP-binding cassette domain-containing protein [Eubacteriales bacterium]